MRKTNESKLLPRLRFPEFRNEEGWEMKKVGEVIEESKVPSTSNNPHNRITVRLNQKGVEKREVRGTEADNATYFFIRRKGQFIYGKQNLHKGAFGLIPDELDGFESSQDIPAFDFKNGYYPQYFVYYLGQENVYPDLEKISTGTGSKRIHPRDLFQVKFPFPKTEEQQKIAACLSSLDDVINAESKKLEVLKEHKKGLLQNLFPQEGETVPKLRFKEFEDSGEWVERTLGEVSDNVMYGMNSAAIMFDGENKYIRITDIDDNTRLFSPNPLTSPDGQLDDKYFVNVGDILFARTGASVGKSYLHQKENGKIYFAGFLIRFTIKNANPYFIYLQTLTEKYQKWVSKTSLRSGQPGINAEEFKSYPILISSLPEQQRIASCLSSLDNLINAQSQKIETLKLHKKGLLQGLFPDINEHNG